VDCAYTVKVRKNNARLIKFRFANTLRVQILDMLPTSDLTPDAVLNVSGPAALTHPRSSLLHAWAGDTIEEAVGTLAQALLVSNHP
jgi:hypothetical protein